MYKDFKFIACIGLQTLKDTYTRLHEMGVPGQYYQPVHMYVMNPKAVTIGELYGEVNAASNEWHDGLLGVVIRHACSVITFSFIRFQKL